MTNRIKLIEARAKEVQRSDPGNRIAEDLLWLIEEMRKCDAQWQHAVGENLKLKEELEALQEEYAIHRDPDRELGA